MTTMTRWPLWAAALLATGVSLGASDAQAFLHEPQAHGSHRGKGCFVTTSPAHHTKGIRHWRSPCPHQERRHMNPYHPGYHRLPPGH